MADDVAAEQPMSASFGNVRTLHDRDLGSETAECLAELAPDVAAPDDERSMPG